MRDKISILSLSVVLLMSQLCYVQETAAAHDIMSERNPVARDDAASYVVHQGGQMNEKMRH
jgi:hypothetical protein